MSLELAGFMFLTFASFSEFGRDVRRPNFFKNHSKDGETKKDKHYELVDLSSNSHSL